MADINGVISYQSIYVESGITANVISATTISANTFFGGSLSASFIGNKDVNDQEFKYISGITSDTQTQINTKRKFDEPFIISGDSPNFELILAKKLVGDGIVLDENGTTIEMNAYIKNLVLNTVTVSSGILTAETNFNPTGWSTSPSQSASFIILTQESVLSVISGLSGGIPGRICVIRNGSTKSLFVFEHDSNKTTQTNKFLFGDGEGYFLLPEQNITLIYSGLGYWTNLYPINKKNKYRNYTDFGNTVLKQIGAVVYSPSARFTSGISNFGAFNIRSSDIVSFLDSNDCLSFGYATGHTFKTIRPFRGDPPGSVSTLSIGKISLNSDIGWTDTERFLFGMGNTGSQGGSQTATEALTPIAWLTPKTLAVDKTVWYKKNSTSITPTSLKLSSTTNNWVYLINYCSVSSTPILCQLYSFDLKTFTIETNASGPQARYPNIWSQMSVSTSNKAYIDELMFTSNRNF